MCTATKERTRGGELTSARDDEDQVGPSSALMHVCGCRAAVCGCLALPPCTAPRAPEACEASVCSPPAPDQSCGGPAAGPAEAAGNSPASELAQPGTQPHWASRRATISSAIAQQSCVAGAVTLASCWLSLSFSLSLSTLVGLTSALQAAPRPAGPPAASPRTRRGRGILPGQVAHPSGRWGPRRTLCPATPSNLSGVAFSTRNTTASAVDQLAVLRERGRRP